MERKGNRFRVLSMVCLLALLTACGGGSGEQAQDGAGIPADTAGGSGGAGKGVVRLVWDPPAADATASVPVPAGYRVYYGNQSGSYGNSIDTGTDLSGTVTGLPAGTYYFAVVAYDADGHESGYSNEAVGVVP